jgi:hypothetical protein
MPRLVALASAGQPEIILAAGALLGVLALYRVVERPEPWDLVVLAGAIPFTMGGSGATLALPAILTGLALVLILRRHDYRTIPTAFKTHPCYLAAALVLVVVFTQLPYVGIQEYWVNGPLNRNGLQGSLANLSRYFLESLHFTQPVEKVWNWMGGNSLQLGLEKIHGQFVTAPFGTIGAAEGFRVQWSATLPNAWFGPLACLLVLPAVAYSLLKGPRRLKAVAVALWAYLYLITLIPAWRTANGGVVTPFFVLGGICTAYFLPPWRFTRGRRIVLQLLCAGLLAYGCYSNSTEQGTKVPPQAPIEQTAKTHQQCDTQIELTCLNANY